MANYSDFIGLYPLQKTLRFELKPEGRTWDNLEECGYLQDDFNRISYYEITKGLMNDYHRRFIEECLSRSEIDWKPLEDAIRKRKSFNDKASSDLLKKTLAEFRKKIAKLFSDDERFSDIMSAELLKKYVWPEVTERGDETELAAKDAYNRFAVYFQGYHENRSNIYDADKPKVSVPSRVVDENFLKFVDNCEKFDKILSEKPHIIQELKDNLGISDVEKYFSVSYYNNCLIQSGIDDYNYILQGKVGENEIIQGLNVLLNLEHQKDPGFKKILMAPLYKQILGNANSKSFMPKQFENDAELIEAVCGFCESVRDKGSVEGCEKLFSSLAGYDTEKIYISKTELPLLSVKVFDGWDAIEGMLSAYYSAKIGNIGSEKTKKAVEKALKEDYFTLGELIRAAGDNGGFGFDNLSDKVNALCTSILENAGSEKDLRASHIREGREEELDDSIMLIRSILDPYMELLHLLKIFVADESLSRDESFYSELGELISDVSEVIAVFNKARNYCTKKRYDISKVKLKLGFPTLAGGWDINKERDNGAVILRKGRQYYLAVMNAKDKTRFESVPEGTGECYEKMDYKYLPSPVKMLPKVFFSKKWVSEHPPSQYILDGREAKKMNAGETFDLKFCRDYIDYFKNCINQYEEWKPYDFKFSPTDSYNSMQDFYREIVEQSYRLSFRKISVSEINKLVNEKKLFLFQIRNKDFSEKSKGMPNLHTLYWLAAFSEENLRNTRIKLNGEAEVFFRKASIQKPTVHKKGSVLVARRDNAGKPIPAAIYHELFKYKTGQISSLSPEAKEYESRLVTGTSNYDIVKDRRFTVDKMFFHVPLTFNFGFEDQSKSINRMVLDKLMSDKDFKIIGLDRGERNLVYYSMIDRSGKILEQGSFNTIGDIDYQTLLDQRQRGNQDARRNWNKVENIKELKSGYISHIINKLAHMIIDNNAIVVMEDLNYGFKHGRFKIEKQIYQKFESALIEKLNYLVFKDKDDYSSDGRVLRGYQLTAPLDDVKNVGKQTGVLFYVPASYTSKIDPTTGFANLFNLSAVTTVGAKKEFLSKMDSINYDAKQDMFCFAFDYRNYPVNVTDSQNKWEVWTAGERYTYRPSLHEYERKVPTEIIKDALKSASIGLDGQLKEKIITSEGRVVSEVFYALELTLSMRVQNRDVDYIISPVKGADGRFFRTGMNRDLPLDADANGAYNIALKGEMMMRSLEKDYVSGDKVPLLTASDWFRFIQQDITIRKNRS